MQILVVLFFSVSCKISWYEREDLREDKSSPSFPEKDSGLKRLSLEYSKDIGLNSR